MKVNDFVSCDVCNEIRPDCYMCVCGTILCPPCINVCFGRCDCGLPVLEKEKQ